MTAAQVMCGSFFRLELVKKKWYHKMSQRIEDERVDIWAIYMMGHSVQF